MRFAYLSLLILAFGPGVASAAKLNFDVPPGQTSMRSVPIAGPTSLVVDNARGAVEITEHPGDALEIEAVNVGARPLEVRLVWTKSDELRIFTHAVATRANLFVVDTGPREPSIDAPVVPARVNLTLRMPRHLLADLRVTNNHGAINLRGYFAGDEGARARRIYLESHRAGAISCDRVSGRLDVRAGAEAVCLEKVIGDVYVRTFGSIYVVDGAGDAELDGGEIFAARNRGDLTARSVVHQIEVEDQTEGRVEAFSQLGDIRLDNPHVEEVGRSVFGKVVQTRLRKVRVLPPPTLARDTCLEALIAELDAR